MGFKKYVKDYEKEYIIKPNGRPGLTAVYKGKYFRFALQKETLHKARIAFSVLAILTVLLAIAPLCYKSVGSRTMYVALPHVISFFPIAHLLLGVSSFCFAKPPMVREQKDKAENRIINSSISSAIFLAATAVAELINCIISGFPVPDLMYSIFLFVASLTSGAIFLVRRVLKTEECDAHGKKIN